MAINPDKCIKVTGRFHSTQGTVGEPALTNVVAGADEVYDDTVPYRYNGHIDCKEVTPVGTENPQELEWYEKVYDTLEPTSFEWVKTTDTSVDSEKTYGISIGAKQSDVNKQLYDRLDDIYEVTINADDVSKVITSDANKIINKEDGYVPTAAAVGEALGANFEDSLTSTSTVKGLTANMGRELNELKANKNGWYEQLVSGASLSLIGDDVDHKATFLERETGDSTATGGINYSVDKGTATIEAIYGHTEKWNQLAPLITNQNSRAYTSKAEMNVIGGVATITVEDFSVTGYQIGYAYKTSIKLISSHTYYFGYTVKSSVAMGFDVELDNITTYKPYDVPNDNQFHKLSWIKIPSNADYSVMLVSPRGTFNSENNTYYIKDYRLIDLTAIFGAGNEPSTVEEFEAWLANNIGIQDYYDYTPGTLINLNPDSLVSTGFNQWDEEWELGKLNLSTGQQVNATDNIRSKNFFKVFPNTAYYGMIGGTSDIYILWYNDNREYIYYNSAKNRIFTSPQTATLAKIYTSGNTPYGTTYNHDICINLSDPAKNGTYMPYMKPSTVDLSWIKDIPDPNDSSKKLFPYGLLKAGNVYDEVTATKAIKRIGSVDLGTLTWQYFEGQSVFAAKFTVSAKTNNNICSKYTTTDVAYTSMSDKSIKIGDNGFSINNYIIVKDSAYTDAATFKAAMSGVILYYELATPIEVTFEEPDTHPMNYEVEDGGREKMLPENTSTPTTTSLVADIRYPLNALEAIRNLQNNFSTQGALYQTFNSLCSALNSAITTGTFAVAPDETVVGKFNFTFTPTENTQSVESNETI